MVAQHSTILVHLFGDIDIEAPLQTWGLYYSARLLYIYPASSKEHIFSCLLDLSHLGCATMSAQLATVSDEKPYSRSSTACSSLVPKFAQRATTPMDVHSATTPSHSVGRTSVHGCTSCANGYSIHAGLTALFHCPKLCLTAMLQSIHCCLAICPSVPILFLSLSQNACQPAKD